MVSPEFRNSLTVAFEFGLGYSRGLSWNEMLADYNILAGRLWLLVPVTLLASPALAFRLRRRG